MNKNKTKGQLEADISIAFTRFEKDQLGRGPKEAHTFIIHDMLLVRLKGVLTPAEVALAKDRDGAQLIKQTRMRLIESSRPLLEKIVHDSTGAKVTTIHTDISTRLGERIFVIGLDRDLEQELKNR
ncbi:MAG: DUF2294 domain-containing protein [FCB group bacterium]|nr:DUF2294 domain-containing protein [FCB group bacterium]